jgi:hypothetical protein
MTSFHGITYRPITREFVVSLPQRKPKLVGITHTLEEAIRMRDAALANKMRFAGEADLGSAQSTAPATRYETQNSFRGIRD